MREFAAQLKHISLGKCFSIHQSQYPPLANPFFLRMRNPCVEALTGDVIAAQMEHISLGTCLLLALVVYGSMVPILKGVKNEAFGGWCVG